MSVCSFPNDTKITTMTPLRNENILITCKYNIYKTNRQSLFHKKFFLIGPRDGTTGGKSQIVRTPLRVKHVSAGKPDWIFFYLKSPIDFTVF